jgi:hypothetical protein
VSRYVTVHGEPRRWGWRLQLTPQLAAFRQVGGVRENSPPVAAPEYLSVPAGVQNPPRFFRGRDVRPDRVVALRNNELKRSGERKRRSNEDARESIVTVKKRGDVDI